MSKFLLHLLSLYAIISLINCQNSNEITNNKYQKRKVTIYYESLSPYCLKFFTSSLWNAIRYPDFYDMVDLEQVPFGFSTYDMDDQGALKLKCSKGESECIGNVYGACAVRTLEPKKVVEFVVCMGHLLLPGQTEKSIGIDNYNEASETCAIITRITDVMEEIRVCKNLILDKKRYMAISELETKTKSENPKYFPWITVDGVWSELINFEASKDIQQFICRVSKGPKPEICIEKNYIPLGKEGKQEHDLMLKNSFSDTMQETIKQHVQSNQKDQFESVSTDLEDTIGKIHEQLDNKDETDSTQNIEPEVDQKLKDDYEKIDIHVKDYMIQTDKLVNRLNDKLKIQFEINKLKYETQCHGPAVQSQESEM